MSCEIFTIHSALKASFCFRIASKFSTLSKTFSKSLLLALLRRVIFSPFRILSMSSMMSPTGLVIFLENTMAEKRTANPVTTDITRMHPMMINAISPVALYVYLVTSLLSQPSKTAYPSFSGISVM